MSFWCCGQCGLLVCMNLQAICGTLYSQKMHALFARGVEEKFVKIEANLNVPAMWIFSEM